MKKLLSIFVVVLMLMAGTALADDVGVNSILNNSGSSVNLGFTMNGNLSVITDGYTADPFTGSGSGITPGAFGETNTFGAAGTFSGTYNTSVGQYGALGTFVNASGDAVLQMTDYQNFDGLSGNGHNGVTGDFYAYAGGTNAAMNLKSIGSMYCWSEATNGGIALQGQWIEKGVSTSQNGNLLSNLYLGIQTNGTATMHNSTAWGWGTNKNGVATTTYGSGTRTVSADGAGTLIQTGYGANNLTFNSNYTLPGGGAMDSTGLHFFDGISGTYDMSGN